MRVLVADDDEVLTFLFRSALQGRGWEVDVAMDAMQALMFAVRTPPDAIVLDINMPGGNGTAALKRLKSSSRTSGIPVVVVSGTLDPAMPETVRALGAEEFMQKPIDLDELHRVLCWVTGREVGAG